MSRSPAIRVVIVDDHPLFREGVSMTLAAEPDLDIVGQGSTVEDAVVLAGNHFPDLLLLDLDIPGGGIAGIAAVREVSPTTHIVVLTALASDDALAATLRAGAHGYVLKEISARELAAIIRSVIAGRRYVAPDLAAHMLSGILNDTPRAEVPSHPLDGLSDREQQILALVADGARNREIADQLKIAEKTVKHYMTGILQKLGVRNRVEAALAARALIKQNRPPEGM